MSTQISWTEETVNPIRATSHPEGGNWAEGDGRTAGWHCEKVSPGCANCYAEKQNFAMARGGTGLPYVPSSRDRVTHWFDDKALHKVLSRRKPTTWFWCSMTDMFGEWVPDEWIDRCFAVMALTPQHRHIVLTKRAKRMREYMTPPGVASVWDTAGRLAFGRRPSTELRGDVAHPLPNVILGVTAENQRFADERIPDLLATPAACRMVSCEPLLGPLFLSPSFYERWTYQGDDIRGGSGDRPSNGSMDYPRIDWVIVGGESGAREKVRPCSAEWIRDIVRQCDAAGVAVHVKQLGSAPHWPTWESMPHGVWRAWDDHHAGEPWPMQGFSGGLRHPKGGSMEEWPEDLRRREFPEVLR